MVIGLVYLIDLLAAGAGRGQSGRASRRRVGVGVDYRKSTLARGSRWDYTPLPF